MNALRVTIYVRLYCHLCEDMLVAVNALRSRYGFELEIRDVDEDPRLCARFGDRVPVLVAGDDEICHYRLDEEALLERLSAGAGERGGG